MKSSEIRRRFLSYFSHRGHEVVPSSGLVPEHDPSLFFVNAGMVPFKDVFTGKEHRAIPRATTVQKCLRVSGKHNDLENVGRTPRHHTFFEMLGNFSFGDYFKPEAIPMAWELLTGELGLDPARLWITVYETDDEAYDLWADLGVPRARIQRLGAKDNFWSMGDTGPCGPCSEIHYDHGPSISSNEGGPATEDPRYVEIWNLVFMQYDQAADGTRTPLPRPSIDTGAGLERIAAVVQGKYSNYDTDLFLPLLHKGAEIAGARYGADPSLDTALRVIADHGRATAFLISDGTMPSNEGRGYVLRRIMRRAIRFGVKIGIDRPFFHQIADRVVQDFGEAYPELHERRDFLAEVVRGEEERFRRTLDRGLKLLDDEVSRLGAGARLDGDFAFTLSDTYGFPVDLTRQIAEEYGLGVDEQGYEAALEAQRQRGRAAWKGSGEAGVAELWYRLAEEHGATSFTGYDHTEDVARVLALFQTERDAQGELQTTEVERLEAGQRGIVLLDRTPFYAESGGQVGDAGQLVADHGVFAVLDTTRTEGLHLHRGRVLEGDLRLGGTLTARVDGARRDHTRRNHTGTHLLHAALRQVLGDHVMQKGSLVGPDRLRFDFSHHKAMTPEELAEVEELVNQQVLANTALETSLDDLEAAKAKGAMALFGEKYGEVVRVVSVPGFSVELCGGTHCRATGDIGLFKIVSEGGIAAGVRRLEAQTGVGALRWVRDQSLVLEGLAAQLKTTPAKAPEALERLQDDKRRAEKALEELQREVARSAAADLEAQATDVGGVKVLAASFTGDLKEQADRLRDRLGTSVVVLASPDDGKVTLLVAVTKDVAGSRVHAGQVIKEIAPLVGGRGGGRPDMAQAGGKDPSGIDAALDRARAYVTELLSASSAA